MATKAATKKKAASKKPAAKKPAAKKAAKPKKASKKVVRVVKLVAEEAIRPGRVRKSTKSDHKKGWGKKKKKK